MQRVTRRGGLAALVSALGLAWGGMTVGEGRSATATKRHSQIHELLEGTMTFRFDETALASLGVRFVPQGELASDAFALVFVFEMDPAASPSVEFSGTGSGRFLGGSMVSCGAFLLDRPGERVVIGNLTLCGDDAGGLRVQSTLGDRREPNEVFEIGRTLFEWDRTRRQVHFLGELLISPSWAGVLGLPEASGVSVGEVSIEALVKGKEAEAVASWGDCRPIGDDGRAEGGVAAAGSDVLVAELQSIARYTPVGDITAYAVGTTACNIGTQRADWVAGTNQHPVIIQNLYRLRDDRFEQIGMSWVKHGFYAISESYCGTCTDPTNGTQLGVGCSDPYSANLNGIQTNMSPRSTVNPNTGFFNYPWSGPTPVDSVDRRLQVQASDLDPAQNPGARYFVEGHYVHPDDCAAGTQDNNASYREVNLTNPSAGTYNLVINPSWTTQRGRPAVRAWRDADPSVVETDIRVPGEGLFVLAGKATPVADGYWRYAYALQNLNSDRAAQSFSLDLPAGASVANVSFHDVPHHSGEPYTHTPWSVEVTSVGITWSSEPYPVNPDANALRFDTIYGFYFDVNVEPDAAKAQIGLFKPGGLDAVAGATIGPRVPTLDCNGNTISDLCDVDCDGIGCVAPCGGSTDCDANLVPDECQPDSDLDGHIDRCDNCPAVSNAGQEDFDADGEGDACDPNDIVWNSDPLSTSRGTRTLTLSVLAATATGTSGTAAIHIELIDLQNPDPNNPPCCPPQNFSAYEFGTCTALNEGNGCVRWVGPPVTVRESQDNLALGTVLAARLQCSPYYTDWATLGSITVVGPEIMPSSTYELSTYGSTCKGAEANCSNISAPVQALTRRSGDVSSPFAPAGTQPDPQDVVAVLNKFKSQPGSPSKSIAQIQPNVIELNVDVGALDIAATIDAFKGFAYPFSGPCPCPSLVTCNATVCSSPGVCSGGLCVRTCNGGTNTGQPCLNDTHCPGSTCPSTGFCRDRCGRCQD